MAAIEITGRILLAQGLASSFRPRKYYTIPKETVEAVLEDFEQLVDFFLIEFQRILFAENIVHTVVVCHRFLSSELLNHCLNNTSDSLAGLFCSFFLILADQDSAVVGIFFACCDRCLFGTPRVHL